jgi:hypothetical protein
MKINWMQLEQLVVGPAVAVAALLVVVAADYFVAGSGSVEDFQNSCFVPFDSAVQVHREWYGNFDYHRDNSGFDPYSFGDPDCSNHHLYRGN